jgi:hypothetical protein
MSIINNWRIVILLCLTLGLAPYHPEPHLVGKINWILGGGKGMKLIDVFDLLLHGFPFILLIRIIYIKINLFRSNNAN